MRTKRTELTWLAGLRLSFWTGPVGLRRRRPGWTVLCIWLGLCAAAKAQPYFEIKTEIEAITYQTENTNDTARTERRNFSATCIVGTNEWRIDTDFMRGGESKWFFDGTNIYESLRRTEPVSVDLQRRVQQKLQVAPVPFEAARSNLTINVQASDDGHPRGHPGANIPWLAFCSGTYLKRQGRIIPLPVSILRHDPYGFAYSDKTETFEDEFGLPRTVDLLTSQSLIESSVQREHFLGKRDTEYWKRKAADIQDGILKFHYAVTDSTNVLGWNFPLRFEYFQNEPGEHSNWVTRARGTGKLTSIRPAVRPKNLFAPEMRQTIVDYRFRHDAKQINALVYTSQNTYVAPTNDALLQQKFTQRIQRPANPRAESLPPAKAAPRARLVFAVVVLLAAIVPLIMMFSSKMIHRHQNNSRDL